MEKRYIHALPIQPTTRNYLPKKSSKGIQTDNPFANHLKAALDKPTSLTISKHARERIENRAISLSANDWLLIEEKIAQAKEMGINESLVMVKDVAFIISVTNETVITAMNREEAASQIFTNIDGAILLET
ncbi:TIGR02530 family flagellar biosynthesis protein [Bacillus spongiae]|uniref:TIGR02530 family flagellar biosynthesis protein n=1 Tax=Bacillus spongiae TaxID=2683610 RepID=A0ABU8HAI0_9BACI